jgi:hypothetical protein
MNNKDGKWITYILRQVGLFKEVYRSQSIFSVIFRRYRVFTINGNICWCAKMNFFTPSEGLHVKLSNTIIDFIDTFFTAFIFIERHFTELELRKL